jgi:hypothetical protein
LASLVRLSIAQVQDAAAAQDLFISPPFLVSMIDLQRNKAIFEETKSSMKWAIALN